MRLHPGEVPATGWRVEKLSDVSQRLRQAAPDVAGRPRVIAIDGRGGAGKSTLVERLQMIVPASGVVHTDDIAWNQAYFEWGALMIENILRPLHQGDAVTFRPPAWIEHGRPGVIHVPAGAEVVWVEGTGTIREEFASWIDASIWLQGDLDEQENRLATRDGDSAAQRQHIAAWLAEELPLMLREQPWQKATIVVAGTTELDYKSETEIVVASPTAPFQRVGTELGKVIAQRRLDVDGDSWTASIGEPRPYDSAASDWFVPLTVENGRGQTIWSSRAGGVDAVQALTLALVALGNHLSAERETGRSISYLGGEELGSPVTQVTEGGVVPPAMIRFAR